jgi:hypothetical protein
MAWMVCALVLGSGGFVALSLTRGQDRAVPSSGPQSAPPRETPPRAISASLLSEAERPARDLSKLPHLHQQMYLSAQRGADWLRRANRVDGRFVDGYLPALKTPLEGEPYLRQAGTAFALARAARFLGEERYIAVARLAVLRLLVDTAPDPKDPQVRATTLPSVAVNRLAAAGLLVLAINELPAPESDLLEQSEQLCGFIRRQQRGDGSLSFSDSVDDAQTAATDPEGGNYYPGQALYALMLSQRHRPAGWKTDAVRKALAYYRPWWRAHKNMAFIPWQTMAYTEAYLRTKEQAFADFVTEMNDWLCSLQHAQLDARHPLWYGGFMDWADGRPATDAPKIHSASFAESLAEGCRVARQAGDVARHQRYREALERCLQFLTTLQYTDANTQHFADWYRPVLLGAFHASHQDGNLRLDYTQHAVCALVQYLTHVAETP